MDGWESGAAIAGAAVAVVVFLSLYQRPKVKDVTFGDVVFWHRCWHTIESWIASDASTPDLSLAIDKLLAEAGEDRAGLLSQVASILDGSRLDQDPRVDLAKLIGSFFSPLVPTTSTGAPPTTTPSDPVPDPRVAQLEADLAAKTDEVDAIRRVLAENDAKVAAGEEGLRVTRDALRLADAELATVKRQLADADQSGTIAQLQATIEALQTQLDSQPADQSGQVAALTAELDQLRAQRDADAGTIASLTAQVNGFDGDLANLRSQLANSGAEKGELVQALQECQAARADTSSVDALNAEIVALRAAADAAQAQLGAVAAERDSLAAQVGAGNTDAANLQAELASARASVAQVTVERDAANARADAATAEIESLRGVLAAEQGRANAGVDVLAGKDAEIQALRMELENATNRAGTLDSTLAQLQAAQAETESMRAQYVAATDQAANLTAALAAAQADNADTAGLRDLLAAAQAASATAVAEADSQRVRADGLQATIDALRAQLGAAQATPTIDPTIQAELDSLRSQTEELAALRAQVASTPAGPPPELVTELDSLRAQVSAHQATDAELSALRAQVAELSQQPPGIPGETLAAEQARSNGLQASLDALAAELAALRQANEALAAQYAEAIARIAALQAPAVVLPNPPVEVVTFPEPIPDPAPVEIVEAAPMPAPEPIVEPAPVEIVPEPAPIPEPVVSEAPRPALIEDAPPIVPAPEPVVEVTAAPFEVAAGDPAPQGPGNADATDRDPVAAAAPWMVGQHVDDTPVVTPVTETIADLGTGAPGVAGGAA